MPAVVVRCGCRVFIAEAHVEHLCENHANLDIDRYAVRDILADTVKEVSS